MSSPERARPKVAVFGVGHLGSVHARILSARADVELAAVVDTSAERVQHVAHEVRCPARLLPSSAPGDVLEACPAGVSAVVIAVPTRFHAAVAVPLLERGIGCLVEKPLAHDLESARAILAAARRGGATLSVGHVERFQPGIRKVRDLRLAPRFIECQRVGPYDPRVAKTGVTLDLMIHDIDIVLDLVKSRIKDVESVGAFILSDTEDIANTRIHFADNITCDLTASRMSSEVTRKIRIFQDNAYIVLDYVKQEAFIHTKANGRLHQQKIDITRQDSLKAELSDFIHCVKNRKRPLVSGEEGRNALALALRITQQIKKAQNSVTF